MHSSKPKNWWADHGYDKTIYGKGGDDADPGGLRYTDPKHGDDVDPGGARRTDPKHGDDVDPGSNRRQAGLRLAEEAFAADHSHAAVPALTVWCSVGRTVG